jgi:hypothetical protein
MAMESFDANGLISILEDTQRQPGEELDDSNIIRTHVEAWEEQVRAWLSAHPSAEERREAAQICGGKNNVTPLHMMCMRRGVPADVVQSIVESAPMVATLADSYGWLPLHRVCAHEPTLNVLSILITAYPEGKVNQDKRGRTPLHFYLSGSNVGNMTADIAQFLSDTGAAKRRDQVGMLPMHYACSYGANPCVLKVLSEAYPESLVAKVDNGRTALHFAMVNAARLQSPDVIRFLLGTPKGKRTATMTDDNGNLPLHQIATAAKAYDFDDAVKVRVIQSLKIYLSAKSIVEASPDIFESPEFLSALLDLPSWLQDVDVIGPDIHAVINQKRRGCGCFVW